MPLQSRRELLSMNFDPTVEGGINPEGSVANLELRSVVCIPLIRIKTEVSTQTIVSPISETVGLIYLDSRLSVADLSQGNREILQTLALEASTVLENARLLEQERGKQALEQELKIARTIQQGLLPRSLPTTGWFRVSGSSVSSQQVGGDYYDAAEITQDNWRLVVADVSGKGVSSALLASLLQGAFLVGASDAAGIESVLSRVNQYLFERTEGEKYATVFYLSAHRDGSLHWANAGHCAPILLHCDGTMEHLRPTSMPVGMLDIARFRAVDATFRPGDRVVVFSDGVTEAENTEGKFFEEGRILSVLQTCAGASAAQIHEKLTEALRDWGAGVSQRDDMTLVVAEYNP